MSTVDLIRSCALFSELEVQAAKELAAIAIKKGFSGGTILFHEGDDADALYILVEGCVDLIKSSPEGREQLVRSVKGGEMFAEAVMFSGETYPATAHVRNASKLLIIRKAAFVKLVRAHPEISMAMIGTMAKLLRHLNARLSELSLGSVPQRLASYMLQRMREEGSSSFSIGMPKKELAVHLGTVPETLSRNLKRMREEGLIEVRRDTVIINDIEGLNDISAG